MADEKIEYDDTSASVKKRRGGSPLQQSKHIKASPAEEADDGTSAANSGSPTKSIVMDDPSKYRVVPHNSRWMEFGIYAVSFLSGGLVISATRALTSFEEQLLQISLQASWITSADLVVISELFIFGVVLALAQEGFSRLLNEKLKLIEDSQPTKVIKKSIEISEQNVDWIEILMRKSGIAASSFEIQEQYLSLIQQVLSNNAITEAEKLKLLSPMIQLVARQNRWFSYAKDFIVFVTLIAATTVAAHYLDAPFGEWLSGQSWLNGDTLSPDHVVDVLVFTHVVIFAMALGISHWLRNQYHARTELGQKVIEYNQALAALLILEPPAAGSKAERQDGTGDIGSHRDGSAENEASGGEEQEKESEEEDDQGSDAERGGEKQKRLRDQQKSKQVSGQQGGADGGSAGKKQAPSLAPSSPSRSLPPSPSQSDSGEHHQSSFAGGDLSVVDLSISGVAGSPSRKCEGSDGSDKADRSPKIGDISFTVAGAAGSEQSSPVKESQDQLHLGSDEPPHESHDGDHPADSQQQDGGSHTHDHSDGSEHTLTTADPTSVASPQSKSPVSSLSADPLSLENAVVMHEEGQHSDTEEEDSQETPDKLLPADLDGLGKGSALSGSEHGESERVDGDDLLVDFSGSAPHVDLTAAASLRPKSLVSSPVPVADQLTDETDSHHTEHNLADESSEFKQTDVSAINSAELNLEQAASLKLDEQKEDSSLALASAHSSGSKSPGLAIESSNITITVSPPSLPTSPKTVPASSAQSSSDQSQPLPQESNSASTMSPKPLSAALDSVGGSPGYGIIGSPLNFLSPDSCRLMDELPSSPSQAGNLEAVTPQTPVTTPDALERAKKFSALKADLDKTQEVDELAERIVTSDAPQEIKVLALNMLAVVAATPGPLSAQLTQQSQTNKKEPKRGQDENKNKALAPGHVAAAAPTDLLTTPSNHRNEPDYKLPSGSVISLSPNHSELTPSPAHSRLSASPDQVQPPTVPAQIMDPSGEQHVSPTRSVLTPSPAPAPLQALKQPGNGRFGDCSDVSVVLFPENVPVADPFTSPRPQSSVPAHSPLSPSPDRSKSQVSPRGPQVFQPVAGSVSSSASSSSTGPYVSPAPSMLSPSPERERPSLVSPNGSQTFKLAAAVAVGSPLAGLPLSTGDSVGDPTRVLEF